MPTGSEKLIQSGIEMLSKNCHNDDTHLGPVLDKMENNGSNLS
jgi:hypothetical protein